MSMADDSKAIITTGDPHGESTLPPAAVTVANAIAFGLADAVVGVLNHAKSGPIADAASHTLAEVEAAVSRAKNAAGDAEEAAIRANISFNQADAAAKATVASQVIATNLVSASSRIPPPHQIRQSPPPPHRQDYGTFLEIVELLLSMAIIGFEVLFRYKKGKVDDEKQDKQQIHNFQIYIAEATISLSALSMIVIVLRFNSPLVGKPFGWYKRTSHYVLGVIGVLLGINEHIEFVFGIEFMKGFGDVPLMVAIVITLASIVEMLVDKLKNHNAVPGRNNQIMDKLHFEIF